MKKKKLKAHKKTTTYCLIRADKTQLDGSSWKGWGEPCGAGEVFYLLEYFDIFLFFSSVLWEGNGGRATAAPLAPSWAEGVASYRW